jgi:multidrug efflux pump subunit AcrA (membrane-fusion protein)
VVKFPAIVLICYLIGSLCCPTADASDTASADTVIADLVVVLVEEAAITANLDGTVSELILGEGATVKAGETIVKLDDRKSQIEQSLAERAARIAENQRDAKDAIDAAQIKVSERQQLIAEHLVRSELNERQAANDLKVKAAEKAELVAKNEWTRAQSARQNFADAVSSSEIEALRLAYERSQLETREAIFQREMTTIEVRLDREMGQTLRWQLEAANVALQAAQSAGEVRVLEAEIERLKWELATAATDEHQLRSPINGTIVSTSVHVGDWVRRGQVTARVIGLNRLRVEGFTSAAKAERLRRASEVRVIVSRGDETTTEFIGAERFVSPEMDAVTGEVRLWVEFENIENIILPGSKATLEIP